MDQLDDISVSDAIFNTFPGIAFLLSTEGALLRRNQNFEDFLTINTKVNQNKENFLSYEIQSFPSIDKVIEETCEKGSINIEIEFIKSENQSIPFLLTCKTILYQKQRCILGYALHLSGKNQLREELTRKDDFLNERIKELNTLHATNAILHSNHRSIDEILSEFVKLLPSGWQYPEITAARINFNHKFYETKNFQRTKWALNSEIELIEHNLLKVEVAYLEEKPVRDVGPFLKEEIELINSLANMIASFLEKAIESEKIRELEANLNSIFQSTDTSYILIDKDYRIVMFNQIAYDRTNFVFNKQLKVGRSFFEIVAEERQEITRLNFEKVMAGEVVKYEISYLINNVPFYFLTMFTPIKSENDEVNGICFTSLDFTLHKNFENQKELFVSIVNSSQDAIFSNDLNGIITSWNKSAEKIFGYSENEAIGKHNSMLYPEGQAKKGKFDFIHSEKYQVLENYETKMLAKGNRLFDVSLSESPIKNFQGVISGTSNIVRDITQKKQIEVALLKSEANLQTILSVTKIAYILFDVNLKIISFNNKSVEFVKKELGHTLCNGDFFHDYLSDKHNGIFDHLLRALGGEEFGFEVQYKQYDRSVSWYYFTINPIKNNMNQSIGVLLSIENISEFKKEEMQRLKLTNDFIQRNKDLEQFAYIVSHNLRAPVANIIGLARELNEDSLEEENRKLFGKELSVTVSKLDDVIRDLNFILQVKREVFENKETIFFQKLLFEIWNSLETLAEKENVTLQTDFSELEKIESTKTYLYSIFYNLLTNSIKYRRPGQPTLIQVSSKKKQDSLLLVFKDNGMGIDLEKKGDQLFGMYKRFHLNTSIGKGMGLFITKTQVEAIGGNISVKSNVNIGTEFVIELPLLNE
ncbi:Sensor histidine kinase of a two component response regulator [Leptospira biflexa serovar Patoc strain 'Patoc 1 (Ames)']|uniref:histidine kinase n=1 Tax=Leptospira biflexa serovar Patoc (strain Patoc 1 / ATCC 23582 / Paris) TaxID=456481 RepID=B0SN12_LEPBP|nr:PAS domain S-box protein [Leptospira biflexa]ABZ93567.1 Sensor histidine kinase of a two component response regulator [Leptospira biflexa serovar Patoc strain 'Patoc 1 (Ames)']ABZ97199.1 Putative two-component hybrid sensor and regulator [Leptospira biflexa serovar Patoc strain 'Patoc 1 (Paris)']